eukprot:gene13703-33957_t
MVLCAVAICSIARAAAAGSDALAYANFIDHATGVSRYQESNDQRFLGNHTAGWAYTVGPWSDLSVQQAAGRASASATAPASPTAAPAAGEGRVGAGGGAAVLYTPIVPFGWASSDGYTHFPDMFSPAFAANAALLAKQQIEPWNDDPSLL